MTTLQLDGHTIGPRERTFVIAEIGVNHDGSSARAEQLVRAAADAGADAIKLQVFRADQLIHSSAGFAQYQQQHCTDATPAAMLRKLEMRPRELARIIALARELSLVPLATPFSPEDVETIDHLNLPALKVASPDLVNLPLLHRAAQLHRPILVSTGAATMEEVARSVTWLREWRAGFALLHCISAYPTPLADTHLAWIAELSNRFDVPVGYSDHTTELISGALAVCAGACVVERHLTYDKRAAGPDHAASADPLEFADYVRMIRQAELMRGGGASKCVLPVERDVRTVSRQSLVLRRDVAAGETIDESALTVQRPGTGIPAAELTRVLGQRALRAIRCGSLLQWDMLTDAAAA